MDDNHAQYDREVWQAKQQALRALCSNGGKPNAEELATVLDDLNKAWGALTDCLVRQRRERDKYFSQLLSDLAEANKGR